MITTKLLKCPYCDGQEKIWKAGKVRIVGQTKQRYKCNGCGHTFYNG